MTFPTKDELLAGLSTVRENICAYHGSRVCDCKYGPKKGEIGSSEHTGCPEVSIARDLLKALKPLEYELLTRRANGEETSAIAAYGFDLAGAHAALDRAGVPKDPSFTLVDRIEKLAARTEQPKHEEPGEKTWLLLSTMRIGEVFVTKKGNVGRRVVDDGKLEGYLDVFWLDEQRTTKMRHDLPVARVPDKVVTTKPEPEGAALPLSDLTIGESFKTRTGRTGVRVENTTPMKTYLRVEWDDGATSHEPPSTPVWPIKTMRIATMPVPGLFNRLREMGARVERESLRYSEVRLSIRIGDDPKKHWSSYRTDLVGLGDLITFAKAHVPGPWFVDLEPEHAKPLWVSLGVVEQTQLRALRPNDAPPGFMFSFCGVDVCERQP